MYFLVQGKQKHFGKLKVRSLMKRERARERGDNRTSGVVTAVLRQEFSFLSQ